MSDAPSTLEWLTAAGTFLAAIVPGVLFFVERHGRSRAEATLAARDAADRDERRAQESALREARRTEQARQVYVWKLEGEDDPHPQYLAGLRMRNLSDRPIFDVCLRAYSSKSGEQSLEGENSFKEAVMPGDGFSDSSVTAIDDEVWVTFRDASGQWWARSSNNVLNQNPDLDSMAWERP